MSELRLNTDGHIIKFGADNDVSLTHVADTGLLLNSTRQLQFNDASQNINAPSATVLDINATDEIELNATLVDINANVEISGTATTTGVHTFTAVPVFPNNTVETADIQDNAITLAKLAGGTDGNIISFDASGDPVAIATGSDGQVLTSTGAGSAPAFEALPASGKILQVVQDVHTSVVSNNTNTFEDSGISQAITCSATSSKVLVMVTQSYAKGNSTSYVAQLMRGSTVIDVLDGIGYTGSALVQYGYYAFTYLDSPSSTSAVTYKTQVKSGDNVAYVQSQVNGNPSTITLMEIGA